MPRRTTSSCASARRTELTGPPPVHGDGRGRPFSFGDCKRAAPFPALGGGGRRDKRRSHARHLQERDAARGQQHRGDLQPRDPGPEGRLAERAAGRHHRASGRQRGGQDHDAEVGLEPAAVRTRRDHQGLDRLPRRAGQRPLPGRAGPARRDPGDGGPALLRAPDHRGEPDDRRLHAPRRPRRDPARPRSTDTSPASGTCAAARPATPRAASSRCAPSAGR